MILQVLSIHNAGGGAVEKRPLDTSLELCYCGVMADEGLRIRIAEVQFYSNEKIRSGSLRFQVHFLRGKKILFALRGVRLYNGKVRPSSSFSPARQHWYATAYFSPAFRQAVIAALKHEGWDEIYPEPFNYRESHPSVEEEDEREEDE